MSNGLPRTRHASCGITSLMSLRSCRNCGIFGRISSSISVVLSSRFCGNPIDLWPWSPSMQDLDFYLSSSICVGCDCSAESSAFQVQWSPLPSLCNLCILLQNKQFFVYTCVCVHVYIHLCKYVCMNLFIYNMCICFKAVHITWSCARGCGKRLLHGHFKEAPDANLSPWRGLVVWVGIALQAISHQDFLPTPMVKVIGCMIYGDIGIAELDIIG